MQFERDPVEVAAEYRVLKVGETDFELQAGSTKLELKWGAISLRFEASPLDLRWHADEHSNPFYTARFAVTEVRIGHRDEIGWSSPLVDNCIFVIDGEALRHVPLSDLTVMSEEAFKAQKVELARARGDKPPAEPQPDPPLATATIAHCPASPESNLGETLECTIGIPQPHFEKLVEGCLSGRIVSAHFHGLCGALSSSFKYGSLRDVILRAEAEINVQISSLSFTYRV